MAQFSSIRRKFPFIFSLGIGLSLWPLICNAQWIKCWAVNASANIIGGPLLYSRDPFPMTTWNWNVLHDLTFDCSDGHDPITCQACIYNELWQGNTADWGSLAFASRSNVWSQQGDSCGSHKVQPMMGVFSGMANGKFFMARFYVKAATATSGCDDLTVGYSISDFKEFQTNQTVNPYPYP